LTLSFFRIKSNVETKGKLGTPKINNKGGATSTALAGTTGASDDSKERRSVRQPALNADGTPKTPAAKMTKKVPNSVIIGLDKDSTNISDWAAAKAKRVTSSATTSTMTSSTGQTSTLGMNSVPAGATSSITNSCNVVVETNKNFTEKRIKTRSAKTSGMSIVFRDLIKENNQKWNHTTFTIMFKIKLCQN